MEADDLNDQSLLDFANLSPENQQNAESIGREKYLRLQTFPEALEQLAYHGEIFGLMAGLKENPNVDIDRLIIRAEQGGQTATLDYLRTYKSNRLSRAPRAGLNDLPKDILFEISKYDPKGYQTLVRLNKKFNVDLSDKSEIIREKFRTYSQDEMFAMFKSRPYDGKSLNHLPHTDNEIWGKLTVYIRSTDVNKPMIKKIESYKLFTYDEFARRFNRRMINRGMTEMTNDLTLWNSFPVNGDKYWLFPKTIRAMEILGLPVQNKI